MKTLLSAFFSALLLPQICLADPPKKMDRVLEFNDAIRSALEQLQGIDLRQGRRCVVNYESAEGVAVRNFQKQIKDSRQVVVDSVTLLMLKLHSVTFDAKKKAADFSYTAHEKAAAAQRAITELAAEREKFVQAQGEYQRGVNSVAVNRLKGCDSILQKFHEPVNYVDTALVWVKQMETDFRGIKAHFDRAARSGNDQSLRSLAYVRAEENSDHGRERE